MKKIRVLVIDDSAVVRQILAEILSSDSEIEVVGTAADPYIARRKIKKLNPDVLTLDVEMPKMDGISFLRNLMRLRPMPVVMISSLTEEGADIALEALGLGAVDYVSKPKVDIPDTLGDYASEIIAKVKSAAQVRIIPGVTDSEENFDVADSTGERTPVIRKHSKALSERNIDEIVIAVGASTGGTEAIKEIMKGMDEDSPAMVLAQHIPKEFSTAFAKRMDGVSAMTVCEAEHGQPVRKGHAYIAPGDKHLLLVRKGDDYFCELSNGNPINRHRPSVDVMFRSVFRAAGDSSIGVLLTGMGKDGAMGLKEMHDGGAVTIAQDEGSSIVWGMPGEAVRLMAADYVLPLTTIAGKLSAIIKN